MLHVSGFNQNNDLCSSNVPGLIYKDFIVHIGVVQNGFTVNVILWAVGRLKRELMTVSSKVCGTVRSE